MLEVNDVVNRVLSTPFPPQPLLVLETSSDRAIHLAKAAVNAIAKVNAKKGRPTVVFFVNGPEVHSQVLFRRMRLLSQNDNLRLVLMASGAQNVAPYGHEMHASLMAQASDLHSSKMNTADQQKHDAFMVQRNLEQLTHLRNTVLLFTGDITVQLSRYFLCKCTIALGLACPSSWREPPRSRPTTDGQASETQILLHRSPAGETYSNVRAMGWAPDLHRDDGEKP